MDYNDNFEVFGITGINTASQRAMTQGVWFKHAKARKAPTKEEIVDLVLQRLGQT